MMHKNLLDVIGMVSNFFFRKLLSIIDLGLFYSNVLMQNSRFVIFLMQAIYLIYISYDHKLDICLRIITQHFLKIYKLLLQYLQIC